jgi:hypothetical protein
MRTPVAVPKKLVASVPAVPSYAAVAVPIPVRSSITTTTTATTTTTTTPQQTFKAPEKKQSGGFAKKSDILKGDKSPWRIEQERREEENEQIREWVMDEYGDEDYAADQFDNRVKRYVKVKSKKGMAAVEAMHQRRMAEKEAEDDGSEEEAWII